MSHVGICMKISPIQFGQRGYVSDIKNAITLESPRTLMLVEDDWRVRMAEIVTFESHVWVAEVHNALDEIISSAFEVVFAGSLSSIRVIRLSGFHTLENGVSITGIGLDGSPFTSILPNQTEEEINFESDLSY